MTDKPTNGDREPAQDDGSDDEDLWEECLLSNPQFIERVAAARDSIRRGEGIRLEDFPW